MQNYNRKRKEHKAVSPFVSFVAGRATFLIRIQENTTTDDKIFFCSSSGVIKNYEYYIPSRNNESAREFIDVDRYAYWHTYAESNPLPSH
jgi:hypothetical protein